PVYAPLLEPPGPGPDQSAPYLDRVEQGLRAAGIPVVNLTARFRAAATAALGRGGAGGGSIYFPDDTHWNAAGAALAARDIARTWGGLEPRAASHARLATHRRPHSLSNRVVLSSSNGHSEAACDTFPTSPSPRCCSAA